MCQSSIVLAKGWQIICVLSIWMFQRCSFIVMGTVQFQMEKDKICNSFWSELDIKNSLIDSNSTKFQQTFDNLGVTLKGARITINGKHDPITAY